MANETKTSKAELVAIYRLEFYRKQKNWKFCRKEETKTDEQQKHSPKPAPRSLNKTYCVEAKDEKSLHNQAFLGLGTDNDTIPPSNPPKKPKETLSKQKKRRNKVSRKNKKPSGVDNIDAPNVHCDTPQDLQNIKESKSDEHFQPEKDAFQNEQNSFETADNAVDTNVEQKSRDTIASEEDRSLHPINYSNEVSEISPKCNKRKHTIWTYNFPNNEGESLEDNNYYYEVQVQKVIEPPLWFQELAKDAQRPEIDLNELQTLPETQVNTEFDYHFHQELNNIDSRAKTDWLDPENGDDLAASGWPNCGRETDHNENYINNWQNLNNIGSRAKTEWVRPGNGVDLPASDWPTCVKEAGQSDSYINSWKQKSNNIDCRGKTKWVEPETDLDLAANDWPNCVKETDKNHNFINNWPQKLNNVGSRAKTEWAGPGNGVEVAASGWPNCGKVTDQNDNYINNWPKLNNIDSRANTELLRPGDGVHLAASNWPNCVKETDKNANYINNLQQSSQTYIYSQSPPQQENTTTVYPQQNIPKAYHITQNVMKKHQNHQDLQFLENQPQNFDNTPYPGENSEYQQELLLLKTGKETQNFFKKYQNLQDLQFVENQQIRQYVDKTPQFGKSDGNSQYQQNFVNIYQEEQAVVKKFQNHQDLQYVENQHVGNFDPQCGKSIMDVQRTPQNPQVSSQWSECEAVSEEPRALAVSEPALAPGGRGVCEARLPAPKLKDAVALWSDDVIRELEVLEGCAPPAPRWVKPDRLLEWLLTKEPQPVECAGAELESSSDSGSDASLDEFIRGAHCNPHSTEIELSPEAWQSAAVPLARRPAAALQSCGAAHVRALQDLAAEVQARDAIFREKLQRLPALPSYPHHQQSRETSSEEFPTRDIGLHIAPDDFLAGSHQNHPKNSAFYENGVVSNKNGATCNNLLYDKITAFKTDEDFNEVGFKVICDTTSRVNHNGPNYVTSNKDVNYYCNQRGYNCNDFGATSNKNNNGNTNNDKKKELNNNNVYQFDYNKTNTLPKPNSGPEVYEKRFVINEIKDIFNNENGVKYDQNTVVNRGKFNQRGVNIDEREVTVNDVREIEHSFARGRGRLINDNLETNVGFGRGRGRIL